MMTLYCFFKMLHILSAVLLLAGVFYAELSRWISSKNTEGIQDTRSCNGVCASNLKIALFWVMPFGVLQVLSGFMIMSVQRYSYHTLWIQGTFIGFFCLSLLWCCCLYFQCQSQTRPFGGLKILMGIILLILLFLMANRINRL